MRRSLLTAALTTVVCLFATACTSPPERAVEDGRAATVRLGEPFDTSRGQVFVLRIQDEFRLIRCIPDGPIAGCYEDVYSVPGDAVDWNAWVEIEDVPGLRVAFLSPDAVAVVQDDAEAMRAAALHASVPGATGNTTGNTTGNAVGRDAGGEPEAQPEAQPAGGPAEE